MCIRDRCYEGEAFTKDYHLPNDTAYAETCAAIGLIFFEMCIRDRPWGELDVDVVLECTGFYTSKAKRCV